MVKRLSATTTQDPRLFALVAAAVSIAALYLGRVVLIPFAFALLLSLILTPVVSALEKIRCPRILAIVLVVAALLGTTASASWIASQQFVDLSNQVPQYAKALELKLRAGNTLQKSRLDKLTDTFKRIARELAAAVPLIPADSEKPGRKDGSSDSRPLAVTIVPPLNPFQSVANLAGPLFDGFLITVFTAFILAGREDLKDRLLKLVGRRHMHLTTKAMDDATHRINRYLLLQFLVNVGYGLIIGSGLYLLAVPNALLWGIVAAVFRFLPYIGPPAAGVIPVLIAVAIFPGWLPALAVFALYLLSELAVGNVLEPILYGAHIGLSPLAILVSAIFWTLIWGFAGLLLSTPLTLCLLVLGRYSPNLAFLHTILGDEPVLPPYAQYYQRLLSTDQQEARQVLERYRKLNTLEETYDSVLLPALSLVEQDHHQNQLEKSLESFVYQSTRELIEELGEPAAAEEQEHPPAAAVTTKILCVSAIDEADEIAALMLAQLLTANGFDAIAHPSTSAIRQVRLLEPAVVCISALPPFALQPARLLYTKLRERFDAPRIVVCFWQFEGDLDKARIRLQLKPGDQLVTTMRQALIAVQK